MTGTGALAPAMVTSSSDGQVGVGEVRELGHLLEQDRHPRHDLDLCLRQAA